VHHADVGATLYLLRHLKSSWDEPGLADRDRPLAPRGRKAGKKMARHLRETGVAPDLVLCSPAVRTRATFDAIRSALGEPEARFPAELYGAAHDELLAALRGVEPGVRSVLLVGHNPGLHDLAVALTGRGDEETRERLREKMPTGALATLSFRAGSWIELMPGSGELVDYVVPRGLP
jgi:phosphohistidine phosphatase